MTVQTINLPVPTQLYQRVKQRADEMNRSVVDELLTVVADALAFNEALADVPADIATELQQLAFLDDKHLWQAAKQVVPIEKSEQMETLLMKQAQEGLTESEIKEVGRLQHYAHRIMLIRAEAAVRLQERGYDINGLRQRPGQEMRKR